MRFGEVGFGSRRRPAREVPAVPWGLLIGVGLLLGAALGALLGILLAPASGRITRSRVRRRVDDMRDQLRESAEELESTGQDMINEAGQKVRATRDVVQRKLRERKSNREDADSDAS